MTNKRRKNQWSGSQKKKKLTRGKTRKKHCCRNCLVLWVDFPVIVWPLLLHFFTLLYFCTLLAFITHTKGVRGKWMENGWKMLGRHCCIQEPSSLIQRVNFMDPVQLKQHMNLVHPFRLLLDASSYPLMAEGLGKTKQRFSPCIFPHSQCKLKKEIKTATS